MKRIVQVVAFVAAIVLCASAQTPTYIDFSQMPSVGAPTPMPDSYAGCGYMDWESFMYVTPGLWKNRGPGFSIGTAKPINAAFIGGPYSGTPFPSGAIKLAPTPSAYKSFQPVSITMSAGWAANTVKIFAYNSKGWSDSVTWSLGLTPKTFFFPLAWRSVTELVLVPNPTIMLTPASQHTGSAVVYSFVLTKHVY